MRLGFALACLFWASRLSAQVPEPAFFKGDPKEILLVCAEQAQKLDPHKPLVLARAGRAHLLAGDLAGAKALLDYGATGHSDALCRVGEAWLEAGDLPRAMAAFSLIGSRDFDAKNPLAEAAAFTMDHGHPEEAQSLMERAYALAPGDWQNINPFARACIRRQRPDLAAAWFAKAVIKNRKEEEFWIDVARSFANHGAEE